MLKALTTTLDFTKAAFTGVYIVTTFVIDQAVMQSPVHQKTATLTASHLCSNLFMIRTEHILQDGNDARSSEVQSQQCRPI